MRRLFEHDGLLRDETAEDATRVSMVELFFDLVFVLAITQISHLLLQDLTFTGLAQAAFLFLAVWKVWIDTSWVTNWLDPDRSAVRLALFMLLILGLVMSVSLPRAFDGAGLTFALAYSGAQLGRSLFMLAALGRASEANTRNYRRITIWFAAALVFWIAGGVLESNGRWMLWVIALAIDYTGPALGFVVPGLGRSTTKDWDVSGDHMAERCGLFVIIALGESLVVTGTTFQKTALGHFEIAAFLVAVIGACAMWWLYFAVGAKRGARQIAQSHDPGRIARFGYTYVHLLIVAGIIGVAVSDELVLSHPTGDVSGAAALAIIGGPALYIVGNGIFKQASAERFPLSHIVGLGLCLALVLLKSLVNPLTLSALSTGVLIVVALWEWMVVHR